MRHQTERHALIAVARRLQERGLTHGSSGNISQRLADGFLITPTGVPFERLAPEEIVELAMDDRTRDGRLKPSSEWRFHRDIYAARLELGAVVHVHSTHAAAIACARLEIPAFHYMVAMAGGPSIRCAEYATFGTEELSSHVVAALKGRRACLLANHGLVAAGADLDAAYRLAEEVEYLARVYVITQQIGGAVNLSDDEMKTVLARFATYGRQPTDT